MPFAWGTADCCQFAGDVILALTGIDHRAAFPGYGSLREAVEELSKNGGIVSMVSSVMGEPKPVAFANRGDIVYVEEGIGPTIYVCLGRLSCGVGEKGLVFLPTFKALAAWSV